MKQLILFTLISSLFTGFVACNKNNPSLTAPVEKSIIDVNKKKIINIISKKDVALIQKDLIIDKNINPIDLKISRDCEFKEIDNKLLVSMTSIKQIYQNGRIISSKEFDSLTNTLSNKKSLESTSFLKILDEFKDIPYGNENIKIRYDLYEKGTADYYLYTNDRWQLERTSLKTEDILNMLKSSY